MRKAKNRNLALLFLAVYRLPDFTQNELPPAPGEPLERNLTQTRRNPSQGIRFRHSNLDHDNKIIKFIIGMNNSEDER